MKVSFVMFYYRTIFFTIDGFLCLIFSMISGLTYNISILLFASVTIHAGIHFTTFSLIVFHVLSQLNHMLAKGNLNIWQMRKFMSIHTKELTTIISGSRLYSIVLLWFIVLNVPINLYTVVCIALGIYDKVSLFFLVNIVIYQYNLIFLLHLLSTFYTERVHRCSLQLIHHYVNHWPNLSQKQIRRKLYHSNEFVNRLKLSNYIEKFYTNNRYGISYGPIGLMSYHSFRKVSSI